MDFFIVTMSLVLLPDWKFKKYSPQVVNKRVIFPNELTVKKDSGRNDILWCDKYLHSIIKFVDGSEFVRLKRRFCLKNQFKLYELSECDSERLYDDMLITQEVRPRCKSLVYFKTNFEKEKNDNAYSNFDNYKFLGLQTELFIIEDDVSNNYIFADNEIYACNRNTEDMFVIVEKLKLCISSDVSKTSYIVDGCTLVSEGYHMYCNVSRSTLTLGTLMYQRGYKIPTACGVSKTKNEEPYSGTCFVDESRILYYIRKSSIETYAFPKFSLDGYLNKIF